MPGVAGFAFSRERRTVWSVRRPVKPEVAGSNPVVPAKPRASALGSGGQVAQSVERRSEKPEVDGSTPSLTTIENPFIGRGFLMSDHEFHNVVSGLRTRIGRVLLGKDGIESVR